METYLNQRFAITLNIFVNRTPPMPRITEEMLVIMYQEVTLETEHQYHVVLLLIG